MRITTGCRKNVKFLTRDSNHISMSSPFATKLYRVSTPAPCPFLFSGIGTERGGSPSGTIWDKIWHILGCTTPVWRGGCFMTIGTIVVMSKWFWRSLNEATVRKGTVVLKSASLWWFLEYPVFWDHERTDSDLETKMVGWFLQRLNSRVS